MSDPVKPTRTPRPILQSAKLANVLYDIRGPVHEHAARLEADGHKILRLNIGNPAPFGFEAPSAIVRDMIATLPAASGYSDSRGILSARRAIFNHYQVRTNFPTFDVNDIYLGNGVSELITMTLQAFLNPGDELLIPSPDYPLWTASATLAGGNVVHYNALEDQGWEPDIEDIESKITDRTRGIVVINPNNPTGAVYSKEVLTKLADVARRHDLVIFADEIYDRILYDEAEHISIATLAHDVLCLTFNGLSKTYRIAGYRSGWVIITGPRDRAASFIEGISLLSSMRLCANVPAQFAIQAALGGYQSIDPMLKPGGRLYEQRRVAVDMLNAIPGVSVVAPQGALYAFPRLDPEVHHIHDDEKFVQDLLLKEHILVVQGTGFHYPHHDHFRVVTLPGVGDLEVALERLGNFLSSYRQ
ncbi:pyridoxal phosphate-dependent aminotransferase [Mycetocola tolaasinivorans]|uniref:alanine transaminase n=1 Tax=Mycetocola tolaasinivorans TaxID=76635 RepID=A0A3L7AC87_9MICO|nr:pyridoxal phosphate-dependent aminotransferase [Mycetocola tolaasinivorans]RLP77002.1 pyridoxal phosphate-dependent aminotransferase [Mycetocola tolaasinivorans]